MKIYTLFRNGIVGSALLIGTGLNAQDIHFSQFNQSPLTLNPALAGTTVWIRAGLQYRTQWHAVMAAVPYRTIGASFDIKSKKRWIKLKNATAKYRQSNESGFGAGVNIYNDQTGDGKMNTLQLNLSLAYQIFLNARNMLALGFQGGIMQRKIDFSKLYWGTQYDPSSSTGYNTALYPQGDKGIAGGDNNFIIPDFGVGGVYTYKRTERYISGGDQLEITLGGAMFHVVQPKYSFLGGDEQLYRRVAVHGHSMIGISNTRLSVIPGFMYQRQGPNQEIFAGALFRYSFKDDSKYTGFVKGSAVSAGGFYRNKDAFVLMGMYEFSSYGIGISYDVNISGLKTVSSGRGGFEITLRFLNPAPFIYSQASFNK